MYVFFYFLFFLKNVGMSKSLALLFESDITDVGFGLQGLLLCVSPNPKFPMFEIGLSNFSNPVAITVITMSSSRLSSITAPNMIFASGSTDFCTNSAASFISSSP